MTTHNWARETAFDLATATSETMPQPTATLEIHLSTGAMADFKDWISVEQYQTMTKLDWPTLTVEVTLDDQVLLHQAITGDITLRHEFTESSDYASRHLAIKLLDKDDSYNVYVGDTLLNPMLQIKNIMIEGISLTRYIEDHGQCIYADSPDQVNVPSEFMGQVGEQTVEFGTPLYLWLLGANRHYFSL